MDSALILALVDRKPNNLSSFRLFKHISSGKIISYPAHYAFHPIFGVDLEVYPHVVTPPVVHVGTYYPSTTLYPSSSKYPTAADADQEPPALGGFGQQPFGTSSFGG